MSHRHPRARHVIGQLEHSGRRPDHRTAAPASPLPTPTAKPHAPRRRAPMYGSCTRPTAPWSIPLPNPVAPCKSMRPPLRSAAAPRSPDGEGSQRSSEAISRHQWCGAPALVSRRRAAHLMGKPISMQSSVVISGTPALVGRRPRRSPSGPLRKTSHGHRLQRSICRAQQRRGHLTRRTRRREHHAACERSAPRCDGASEIAWGAHDGLRGQRLKRSLTPVPSVRTKSDAPVGSTRRMTRYTCRNSHRREALRGHPRSLASIRGHQRFVPIGNQEVITKRSSRGHHEERSSPAGAARRDI